MTDPEKNKKPKLLDSCVANAEQLNSLIDYSADAVVSKLILDKSAGTITLFAFDKSQGLSEHAAPYDATVIILDGSVKLTIGGKDLTVCAGQITIMPADVPHSVFAHERFKMLLIMVRSGN